MSVFSGLGGIGGQALTVTVIIISVVIMLGLVGLGTWIFGQRKKYNQFLCIIFETDGLGNTREIQDRAGIFVDMRTGNKRFFMKNYNVGLTPDNIPYVDNPVRSMFTPPKKVYMVRIGLKNFCFLKPTFTNEGIVLKVTEEDLNWMVNAYDTHKRLFSNTLLQQLLPYIAIAFVSLCILIIFIYFFKEFATLKDMAIAMKEASQNMAQYYDRGGATVVSG